MKKISTNAVHNFTGHLEDCCYYSSLRTSSGTTQLKVRMKLIATGWTGHKHTTNLFWKSQLLTTFGTLLFCIFTHGLDIKRVGVVRSIDFAGHAQRFSKPFLVYGERLMRQSDTLDNSGSKQRPHQKYLAI